MKKQEKSALAIFKTGGVVVFPTDTVYGIGCKFNNDEGIDRIYKIKSTPKIQHFPILVSNISQVEKIADIDEVARKLMEKHWPGGLTIILPARHRKPPRPVILSKAKNLNKIGFRMPDHQPLLKMINEVGPIIGTSANFHGDPAPKSYEDLDPNFTKLVDFVLKGECKGGIESTVIDTTVNPPKILRKGSIPSSVILRSRATKDLKK